MKTKRLSDKQAARLEFRKEPMADYYNHWLVGIPSRLRVKKIFKELGNLKGKKLLDIGCEAGYITLRLAQKGAQVTGIDLIAEPIKALRRLLKTQPPKIRKRIKLQVADATKLPFSTNSFDIILATEVIEHITKLDRFISGAYKILKPNGKLILTFPNEELRLKLYPLVLFFGINTQVENKVTLEHYSSQEIIDSFSKKFILKKYFLLPWWLPITHFMVFRKKA